jgi:hypothetical protein
MCIDWNKSAALNGMEIDELKSWFEKYQGSARRIIAVCERCGIEREIVFQAYRKLCRGCAKKLSEAREVQRLRAIEYWSCPEGRESYKAAFDKMRGGSDIVNHHLIYDHSDLSKHVMPMARSMHQKLHRLFQKHGIEIPHINEVEI